MAGNERVTSGNTQSATIRRCWCESTPNAKMKNHVLPRVKSICKNKKDLSRQTNTKPEETWPLCRWGTNHEDQQKNAQIEYTFRKMKRNFKHSAVHPKTEKNRKILTGANSRRTKRECSLPQGSDQKNEHTRLHCSTVPL